MEQGKIQFNKKTWGRPLRLIFGRTTFLVFAVLMQLGVLFSAFLWLSDNVFYVYGGFTLLSTIVVIHIINKRQNPSFQMAWVIPVLVFPVFGALLYLFVELQLGTRRMDQRLGVLTGETKGYLGQDAGVMERLKTVSHGTASLSVYMNRYGHYPIYDHTYVQYYPLGDDMYPRLLEELRSAEHYIFMEYFIVERGEMWDTILEVLKEKVKQGVEVRMMYDGMCSLTMLPYHYPKQLEKFGIRCKMFSPVRPVLSSAQNNRDHRKITVIDGHTAFTGGINLADEYINRKERFGHWKDTGIMLKGDAVNSFLIMFLQMWNVTEHERESYENYTIGADYPYPETLNMDGYVMPYGDSPLDEETVGEHVYIDILNEASHYVHIMTPYLILDSDMITALTFAAKRGIEIIIIMPHIPDKLYAYLLARSYYAELLGAGVKIYEYTPGFVHAKSFTSDDTKAVVGTINLDYRSLHLHFECAAYLYRNAAVSQVEQDFQETLSKCQEITMEECRRYPLPKKIAGSVLRLFAPLM
ncbi:MAG: cardiolipin synthase [Lachnospiraceae bacterium]|nr:cardiolipin synthase [Lachnospiraceae bacterium]